MTSLGLTRLWYLTEILVCKLLSVVQQERRVVCVCARLCTCVSVCALSHTHTLTQSCLQTKPKDLSIVPPSRMVYSFNEDTQKKTMPFKWPFLLFFIVFFRAITGGFLSLLLLHLFFSFLSLPKPFKLHFQLRSSSQEILLRSEQKLMEVFLPLSLFDIQKCHVL